MNDIMIACRKSFTDTLLALARKDRDIVAVTTDARGSVTLNDFAKELPAQFVECGIAEQDAVGISAGLAHSGKKVFVCGPACFYVARSLEQVKVDLAYSRNPVKILGVSGGVAYGALGATHHSLHDIAALRTFPGMNIVLPCDARQTARLVKLLVDYPEPVYVRVGRAAVPDVYGDDCGNHPTQCLADLLTMYEHLPLGKRLEDVNMVVVGDASTPEASLGYALSRLGAHFTIICPEGYGLPQKVINRIENNNRISGGTFTQTTDINAVKGADFIMAEEWCWGRTEEEIKQRDADFKPTYVVSSKLLEKAGENTLLMHVLPANAGNGNWPDEKEVTRECLDGPRSAVWDEAENRLSAMMALLVYYTRPHFQIPDPEDIAYYEAKTEDLLSNIFDRRIR